MNAFQIISVIISALLLLFAIIGVYIKSQIEVTKIQTHLIFLQKDLDRKEVSICKVEKDNREDHDKILKRIDELIINLNVKK